MSNPISVPVVYLAGGMRSNWQDQVKAACQHLPVMFIDPRDHGLRDERAYTAWDLTGVDKSTVVFGYMERDNPSGAGLAVEFGYAAKAGDKHLIYVEEQDFPFSRYFGMVRAVSDQQADSLAKGIEHLLRWLPSQPDRLASPIAFDNDTMTPP